MQNSDSVPVHVGTVRPTGGIRPREKFAPWFKVDTFNNQDPNHMKGWIGINMNRDFAFLLESVLTNYLKFNPDADTNFHAFRQKLISFFRDRGANLKEYYANNPDANHSHQESPSEGKTVNFH